VSEKNNGRSKPGNLLQTNIQGTENSHHASLYIVEVISYLRRHHQFVELNSNIHTYNTQRKMDIHIQSYKTDLYKRSAVNMGSKLYNKLADYIKKMKSYKQFRKELKYFLLLHTFYSVEEFVALKLYNFISSILVKLHCTADTQFL
jgi:hypothetical protein